MLELDQLPLPAGARPPAFPDADVSYAVHECELGTLVLATSAGRLVTSAFGAEDAVTERLAKRLSPRVLRQPAKLDPVRRELDDYLAGRRAAFDVRVDLRLATPFQRAVLEAIGTYAPYGETTTYGALAKGIGKARASQAVGAALRTNPCCVFVPCHRVNGASGSLTGYAGGLAAKQVLLDLEARH
ncbi:methylated-DNA--[protein]-cysteine S-methyltransferase [Flindersiella endophytica]